MTVLDDRLTGYWSDDEVYQGAMEAADIAFRRDRTGWTYWSRDGGGFEVLRFTWRTTADLSLAIDLHELLSGTWNLTGQAVHHHVRHRTPKRERIVRTYQITAGHNVFRKPATLLILSRPIAIGSIGDRFAFKRQLSRADQDPTVNASIAERPSRSEPGPTIERD